MVAGKCANPVRTEELILIEHARQDSAQSFWIDQCKDASLRYAEMPWPGGMDAL